MSEKNGHQAAFRRSHRKRGAFRRYTDKNHLGANDIKVWIQTFYIIHRPKIFMEAEVTLCLSFQTLSYEGIALAIPRLRTGHFFLVTCP